MHPTVYLFRVIRFIPKFRPYPEVCLNSLTRSDFP
jgi:hypothetical protein